ncbi:MAG: hypothetical protein V3S12_00355, partial [Acidiferrobacterales bacterium]
MADSYYPGIAINQQNDDVYVGYVGSDANDETIQSTAVVYFKKSTDGMANWGTEQTYGIQNDDHRVVSLGRTIGDAGGRIMPVWFNDDTDDILVNDGNDIEIASIGENVVGIQPASTGILVALHNIVNLTGSQPASIGAFVALQTLYRSTAGSQPAAAGEVTSIAATSVEGSQPAATGVLVLFWNVVNLAGSQPASSGVLASFWNVVNLAGSQPAATGTAARQYSIGTIGNQPAPTGTIAAVSLYFVNLAGSQPASVGTLTALNFATLSETRIRLDFFTPAGVAVGPGPVVTALETSYRMELDAIGSFSVTIPAEHEILDDIGAGYQIHITREGEGLVFKGIIDDQIIDVSGGRQTVILSGSSLARQFVYDNTKFGLALEDRTLTLSTDDILAETDAASAWAKGTIGAPSTNATAEYNGVTLWSAFDSLAKFFGYHLREDSINQLIDIDAFGDDSGIILHNVPVGSEQRLGPVTIHSIEGMTWKQNSKELWNKVIPVGAGEGQLRFDLRYSDRSSPYTIQNDTGPDGLVYYYLEDSASVTANGRRTKPLQWPDISPAGNTNANFLTAGNALYDLAAEWLTRQIAEINTYGIAAFGLNQIDQTDGSTIIKVGQKIYVVYNGLTTESDASLRRFIAIDADLWVLGWNRTFFADGSDSWDLTVSDVDQRAITATDIIVDMYNDVLQRKFAQKPFMGIDTHGPETGAVDSGSDFTFKFEYENDVYFLEKCTLYVKLAALRANASGAESGGGSTPTSDNGGVVITGGGSSHDHGVSGQTAESGGGSTSGTEGDHNHQMYDFVSSADATTQNNSVGHNHGNTNNVTPTGDHSHLHSTGSNSAAHFHDINTDTLVGKTAAGGSYVIWLINSGGEDLYTFETVAAHDHSTPNHAHSVTAVTSAADTAHTHDITDHNHVVTIVAHTH